MRRPSAEEAENLAPPPRRSARRHRGWPAGRHRSEAAWPLFQPVDFPPPAHHRCLGTGRLPPRQLPAFRSCAFPLPHAVTAAVTPAPCVDSTGIANRRIGVTRVSDAVSFLIVRPHSWPCGPPARLATADLSSVTCRRYAFFPSCYPPPFLKPRRTDSGRID
jgi:hypothetical protein